MMAVVEAELEVIVELSIAMAMKVERLSASWERQAGARRSQEAMR